MSAAVISPFFSHSAKAILCWPGDETTSVSHNGEIVYIPGINTAYEQDGTERKFYSAVDDKGRSIPGTIEIRDLSWLDKSDMTEKTTFSVASFVRHVFGKDGSGRSGAYKELCHRGLRFASTWQEAKVQLAEGRASWERMTLEGAYSILFKRQAEIDAAEKAGRMRPPENPSVRWALNLVQAASARGVKRDEISREEIAKALGGLSGGYAMEPATSEGIPEPAPLSEEEKREIVASNLFEEAEAAGIKIKAADRKAIKDGDQTVIQTLHAEIVAAQARA